MQKLSREQKQEVRKTLYEKQDGACNDCGKQLTLAQMHCHERVFRSQGGKMSLENSIGLCADCHNMGKNARHKGPQFQGNKSEKEPE